jgi:hypothetical protein
MRFGPWRETRFTESSGIEAERVNGHNPANTAPRRQTAESYSALKMKQARSGSSA